MAAVQTTIKRLPSIAKEDTQILKVRIQELEKEVANYKSRLEELRKAKNNLIIKKTTEYVKLGNPTGNQKNDKEFSEESPTVSSPDQIQVSCPDHERMIDSLNRQLNDTRNLIQSLNEELDEQKNLIAALKIENEDAKSLIDKLKNDHQLELAAAYAKNEESMREVRKWEQMYKEWMKMMEDRVTNINRTHSILQRCLDDSNPENNDKSN